jgi:hypothetical protein
MHDTGSLCRLLIGELAPLLSVAKCRCLPISVHPRRPIWLSVTNLDTRWLFACEHLECFFVVILSE